MSDNEPMQGGLEVIEHAPVENKPKKSSRDEITEENCRFEEGEELRFTRVRFPGHARSYAFLMGNRTLMYGQKVVAMSDRGMAVGYINSFPYLQKFKKEMLPLKSINKVATEDDIANEQDVYKKQKDIENTCHRLIEKHELQMNLTHVEFTQFGKKVVFYFIAPARVDFRGLVRDLVGELKLRIELRQISVRDRAASMGALGPCGRELCCSSFLSRYGNVSIKMAKNQNLTLNYSKLNGVCGQLKCCLSYEEDVYSDKRKKLPEEGSFIQTKTGETGKVRKLNILNEQFDMLTDKGRIRRYTFDQVKKPADKHYVFPNRFENISDETGIIVGENDLIQRKENFVKNDKMKAEKKAAKFAIERLIELGDFLPENESRAEMLEKANESLKTALAEKIADNFNPYQDLPQDDSASAYKQEAEPVKASSETPAPSSDKKPNNRNRNRNKNNRKRSNNRGKQVKKD